MATEKGRDGELFDLSKERAIRSPKPLKLGRPNHSVLQFRACDPMAEATIKKISREDCIKALQKVESLSDELLAMMQIPEELHLMPDGSFSLNEDETPTLVAHWLLYGDENRSHFPEYGIHISAKGSNSFCTLVDSGRKIIVNATLGNISSSFSWNKFSRCLEDALRDANSRTAKSEEFNFVVNDNGIMDTI